MWYFSSVNRALQREAERINWYPCGIGGEILGFREYEREKEKGRVGRGSGGEGHIGYELEAEGTEKKYNIGNGRITEMETRRQTRKR